MTLYLRIQSGLETVFELILRIFNTLVKDLKILRKDSRFYLMKTFGRFEVVRNLSAQCNDSSEHFILPNSSNCLVLDTSFAEACYQLKQDGYYQGLRLSSHVLTSLIDFAHINPCYASRKPQLKFYIHQKDTIEKRLQQPIKIAGYLNSHEDCKAFQMLKQDPILLGLATNYFGREPQYHRGEIAWSFPGHASSAEQLAAAQVLHCDINDYKTIKFFFYLTDVDLDCGPHVYLKGTHRNRKLLHQALGQRCASIPDEDLIKAYGTERLVKVCGPAGFGFAGDPYTFHKGILPSSRPRLLLQLEFGMNQYKTWYFS